MDDLNSRQAAIDTAVEAADEWDGGYSRSREKMITMKLRMLPSAQSEQTDCEYCNEDSDGYVRPIEKNSHAFVRFGMNGWELSMKANGWHGSAKIRYCPMCGRELRHG